MKKIILLTLLLIFNIGFSQDNYTKTADYLYKKFEYKKAAAQYLKMAESDKANNYIYFQLANSYYFISNTVEAEKWYAKTLEKSSDKEAIFRYAQVLKSNGKNDEANKQMQRFKSLYPDDLRAIDFGKEAFAKDKYIVKKIEINSEYTEFGAFFNNNVLYFASARNANGKKLAWNEEPFLDQYQAIMNTDKRFSQPTPITEINSKFNDGPATTTKDGKTMYFSTESFRNKTYEKDKKDNLKFSKNSLYRATYDGSKWTNFQFLSINSSEFTTTNPNVSRDGKMLYFSSNRPGGFGGNDVWRVSIAADGTLGTPENLGNKVNTEANESFPFISDDNSTLYFSSNGKNGFGNYDVFSIDLKNNGIALNLGKTINTKADDFSFSFYDENKIGFFASNRDGNDEIYMIQKECENQFTGNIVDEKTNKIVPNASVTLLDENNAVISKHTSNDKGEVNIIVDCDKNYSLLVSKDDYDSKTQNFKTVANYDTKVTVPLNPVTAIITQKEVILNPIYFDLDKWNITPKAAEELDKLVKIMNEYPEMVIFAKSHTDNRASDAYNLSLSDKRAKSTAAYIISQGVDANRISGKGFGETELKVVCEPCTEEQHSLNRRSEFIIVKK